MNKQCQQPQAHPDRCGCVREIAEHNAQAYAEAIAALAAKDARIAELEGLLRQAHQFTLDLQWPQRLRDRIDAALAGQQQAEWPKEQCPVSGAVRDVDPEDLYAATPSKDGQEVPEVVGYRSKRNGIVDEDSHVLHEAEPLMTVAQCKRIVAAKDAEIARLNSKIETMRNKNNEYCEQLESLRAKPATPSEDGPEEMQFAYLHPNGERHTVTVSREEVLREMPDFLFEKLCGNFCQCEPVGETNVVECNCDEYAEEFQLLAAEPNAVTKEVAELRAQHSRIVAAKDAEIARLRDLNEHQRETIAAFGDELQELKADREPSEEFCDWWEGPEVRRLVGTPGSAIFWSELGWNAALRAQPARQVGDSERLAQLEATVREFAGFFSSDDPRHWQLHRLADNAQEEESHE